MKGLDKLYDGAVIMNEIAREIAATRKQLEEAIISTKEIKKEAVTYLAPLKLIAITTDDGLPFTEYTDKNPAISISRGEDFESDEKNAIVGYGLLLFGKLILFTGIIKDMAKLIETMEMNYDTTIEAFEVEVDNRRELRIMMNELKRMIKINKGNRNKISTFTDEINQYLSYVREYIGLFDK